MAKALATNQSHKRAVAPEKLLFWAMFGLSMLPILGIISVVR